MKKVIALAGIISLMLAACGGPKDERTAYIEATIEATCHIFGAENIFDPAVEEEAQAIYKKYGFDATDTAAMEALAEKYGSDEEAQGEILAGLEECGGDLFSGLEEAFSDLDLEEDTMMEDDAMMEEGENAEES